MFYGLNSRNSRIENADVLRQQADSDFSAKGGANRSLDLKNEFAEGGFGCKTNQFRTFSIILPNMIHQSKKRDL